MISVHTSPLDQPGTGDAGGLNVYVVETAKRLGARGVEVEIFTRRTSASLAETVQLAPGVTVRHIDAGPYEGLAKEDLPGQLCAFAAGVMRHVASHPEGHYDLVHSHYWLSGQVGWLATDRWNVPLVHTMHTMAKVKNRALAQGDRPEPTGREIGEEQVVKVASWLVANTDDEARELIELYAADPRRVRVVPPGVDLAVMRPQSTDDARDALGLPRDAQVLLFVGRIQPLKAPDVLVRAAAAMLERRPQLRETLVVGILGGPSGSGLEAPRSLQALARELGVADVVQFVPPVSRPELAQWFSAADLTVVPSHSESFGLVALESMACGTPVVAAHVGGLPTVVGDAGVLLDSHDPAVWSDALLDLLDDEARRKALSDKAIQRANRFSWDATTDKLMAVYRHACRPEGERAAYDPGLTLASVPTAVIP
ncbi:D-inositol-3-phosphate glycosyltransferase [Calidifontibacter sp. DB0510]|uniref:D-inositol-3-phosphate glycosyltransferase n=1 Tax=Metallococcus carri TaxID=1656884 RepID=A0A967EEB5_9MICO|nr:D-inositol-3-phosphate glycosyltransferase [Metallococcus carri]NHN55516.1 D-inositol-3-phosphate glycosyltransferase [Metallococcus carri]NOP38300.1 D-inositol-3-phosphate glycosyltransferase [Calidifontibacter sp. DB2511S]